MTLRLTTSISHSNTHSTLQNLLVFGPLLHRCLGGDATLLIIGSTSLETAALFMFVDAVCRLLHRVEFFDMTSKASFFNPTTIESPTNSLTNPLMFTLYPGYTHRFWSDYFTKYNVDSTSTILVDD